MKKTLIAAAIILPLSLSGCVVSVGGGDGDDGYSSSWQDREHQNRKHIAKLMPDINISTVIDRMGVADFNELYKKQDDQIQVLYYRTNRQDGDGVTSKDECTPLVFKNGQLVGWGETAYQNM
jgi:hypothetical protein